MRISRSLWKTQRETPKEADTISASFLIRGGFIDQLFSGVYNFLPLGLRVHQKIEDVIRQEMEKIGAAELLMPVISNTLLWQETGRLTTIDPPLFKFKDRFKKDMVLNPTHEEIIVDLVRRRVQSFKDLPFCLYQIQDKFRNEKRPQGGLLRMREFFMFDAYSFHASEKDRQVYYKTMVEVYKKIYTRLGLKAIIKKADPGTIGGESSHEFHILADPGEDRVNGKPAIEIGHIFNLGCEYTKKMDATFVNEKGQKKYIVMGCYGIGIGRLIAAIVETHHDEKGIIWPREAAPYQVYLINIGEGAIAKEAGKLYQQLVKKGIEVLFDDRKGISPGEKFADADLIGCPYRLVISEKSLRKKGIELKERTKREVRIVDSTTIDKILADKFN